LDLINSPFFILITIGKQRNGLAYQHELTNMLQNSSIKSALAGTVFYLIVALHCSFKVKLVDDMGIKIKIRVCGLLPPPRLSYKEPNIV